MDLQRLTFVSVHWQAQKRHNLSILHGVGEASAIGKDEVYIGLGFSFYVRHLMYDIITRFFSGILFECS
jgi:hypothetical protein